MADDENRGFAQDETTQDDAEEDEIHKNLEHFGHDLKENLASAFVSFVVWDRLKLVPHLAFTENITTRS